MLRKRGRTLPRAFADARPAKAKRRGKSPGRSPHATCGVSPSTSFLAAAVSGAGDVSSAPASDGVAGRVHEGSSFAHGLAAVEGNADAQALQIAGKLAEDAGSAREIGGLATAFGHREAETRFDRGDGLVEIVAIEREAGFKATRRNVRYDWLTEPS